VSERDGCEPNEEPISAPLRFIVTAETQRLLAGTHLEPDPRRVSEGWSPRFITDGARAEEMMQLYRQLGFEVVADPIAPQDRRGICEHCRVVMQLQFRIIYTRKPPQRPTAE
jgi:hypothetical protein